MDFKLPFLLLVFGVAVAGIVPFAISQSVTEPSMEIDMLVGQTQNPFRIQDENDVNVFCIDPEGLIACGGTRMTELTWSDTSLITFTNEYSDLPVDDTTNEFVFAQWHIDLGNITTFYSIMNSDSFVASEMRRASGSGSCTFALEQLDGGGWTTYGASLSIFHGTASFTFRNALLTANTDNAITDVRVVGYVGTAGDVCEILNTDAMVNIFKSKAFTITQVK